WDNDLGTGDRLWDTSTNWTWTAGGEPKRAPIASDWVTIDIYAEPGNGPIIDADTNAVCEWLDMPGLGPVIGEAVLTMTGGSLTCGGWFELGGYYSGTFRFDLSGGTVDAGADGFYVGYVADSYATINMSGGTMETTDITAGWEAGSYATINMSDGALNTLGYLAIGTADTSQADMNMTGGTVNVGEWIEIGSYTTALGKGHLDLHGGTITAALLSMGGGGEGTMDISDGTMIIDGDYRMPNGWLFDPCSDTPTDDDPAGYTGTIALLAKRGIITAYNTKVGDIITDGNYPSVVGLRAAINLDYDVTNPGQTTIAAGAVDPNLAYDPDPLFGVGGLRATDVNLLSWAAGDNAASHEVYFGTSFADVNNATTASDPNIYRGTQPLADVNYPVSVRWGKTYYWRIDEVNNPTWKGTVWNFLTAPAWATNPSPGDGATGVSVLSPVLSWDPGPEADEHHVYFSTDFNDVNERDPSVRTVWSDPCYPPGVLELETTYYWAVDEVNNLEDPNVWPSLIWDFETTDHITVDNFDSYADHAAVRAVWKDRWLNPLGGKNGAEVFLETSTGLVSDGNSMRYYYRNYNMQGPNPVGSEAVADISALQSGSDWTVVGVKALVLYFQGDPANGQEPHANYTIANDRMWVAVEDGDAVPKTGIVRYDTEHGYDLNDVKEAYFHEWNIDLADPCLADVNMANIAKVYIGFGGVKGGATSKYGAGYTSGGDT
ncbi:MAG: hypothetical protein ACYS21_16155, partial [Planctomycetota bacterium]